MVSTASPNLLTRSSDVGALLTSTAELRSQATFRDVFAVREFRALWLAYMQSIAGDQLARVALTVLVFQRTRSPGWTAATYAMTYLPWVVGGRFSRKRMMVTCDCIRCILVAAMTIPGTPLQMMVGLMFVVTLLNAPFNANRSAFTADILPTHVYPLGIAAITTTLHIATGAVARHVPIVPRCPAECLQTVLSMATFNPLARAYDAPFYPPRTGLSPLTCFGSWYCSRAESLTYEQFLTACLKRKLAARESLIWPAFRTSDDIAGGQDANRNAGDNGRALA